MLKLGGRDFQYFDQNVRDCDQNVRDFYQNVRDFDHFEILTEILLILNKIIKILTKMFTIKIKMLFSSNIEVFYQISLRFWSNSQYIGHILFLVKYHKDFFQIS